MKLTPLSEALDPQQFGGKAAALATALQASLPVPDGFALDVDAVELFASDTALAQRELELCQAWERWAVRSSAVGEDSSLASFAGQHLTRLGVRGIPALVQAIADVRASASSPGAVAYRAKLGISGPPQMGIVLQRLIPADVAGVLFTQNPVTGADEVVIEASFGLGEVIVSSRVTPDRVRLARSGTVLERTLGAKEVRLVVQGDALQEVETTPAERAELCLSDAHLQALHLLASRLDAVWPGLHDVEFAFVGADVFLLQRRPLTTG